MQIPAPLRKSFDIDWGEEKFSVTFKQATGVEDDALEAFRRDVLDQRVIRKVNAKREPVEEYLETLRWEPERIPGEMVRLTLTECDLEDGGKLLFRENMNRRDFDKVWGLLPVEIRNQMYGRMLEVNPDWDPFRVVAESDSES